jgi:hypothetical protein
VALFRQAEGPILHEFRCRRDSITLPRGSSAIELSDSPPDRPASNVPVRRQRSNQLNYVPSLFSYLYSLNADASNEQLILNQLSGKGREPLG